LAVEQGKEDLLERERGKTYDSMSFLKKHRYLLGLSILIIDQLIKYYIYNYHQNLVVLNSKAWLGVVPVWGSIFALIILCGYVLVNKIDDLILYLILGAGISNVIDRMIYGAVVDYISIGNFPIFNLADMVISLGVGVMIWREMKKTRV
jgi:signal peptidase II